MPLFHERCEMAYAYGDDDIKTAVELARESVANVDEKRLTRIASQLVSTGNPVLEGRIREYAEKELARLIVREVAEMTSDDGARPTVKARIEFHRTNFRDDIEPDHDEVFDVTDALNLMEDDVVAALLIDGYADVHGIDTYAAEDELFYELLSLGEVGWDGPFDVYIIGSDASDPAGYAEARFGYSEME